MHFWWCASGSRGWRGIAVSILTKTWEEGLIRSFKLRGYKVKPIFEEHEQQLPYDVEAVTRLFGPFETHTEKQQGSPVT
jgi:hypothetical protein